MVAEGHYESMEERRPTLKLIEKLLTALCFVAGMV